MDKIKNISYKVIKIIGFYFKKFVFSIYFIVKYIFKHISKIKPETDALQFNIGKIKQVLKESNNVRLVYSQKQLVPNINSEFKWKNTNKQLHLNPELESNPHILINGMSGFGKSTLIKSILTDISKNKKAAIIFDAHNEHEKIVKELGGSIYNISNLGFNLFELNGLTINERISELSQLFKEVFGLGYIQTMKLSQCIWYTYRKLGAQSKESRFVKTVPTFYNLLQELNIFINNAKSFSEKNSLLHLKGRIELINNRIFSKSNGSLAELKIGINSLSLESLKTRELQFIYISELIKRLYSTMHENSKEKGLKLYIIIDESELILELADMFIRRLTTEGRKYGIGLIIVTHRLVDLSRQIISNVATFISFFIAEPQDLNYVSDLISGTDPIKRQIIRYKLSNLKINQAIIISTKIRTPMLIEAFNIKKVLENLSLLNKGNICIINKHEEKDQQKNNQIAIAEELKKPVKIDELKLLFNEDEINNLKIMKEIDKFEIQENNTNEEWLMLHNNSLSIEHEVYIEKIHKELNENGIKNFIIDNRNGPDIIAYINGKKIAIEYETGKKNILDTYEMIKKRDNKFDFIIMFINKNAFASYKNFLENKNLKLKIYNIKELDNWSIDEIEKK